MSERMQEVLHWSMLVNERDPLGLYTLVKEIIEEVCFSSITEDVRILVDSYGFGTMVNCQTSLSPFQVTPAEFMPQLEIDLSW